MRKKWKCTAEVDRCADRIETVFVETNTEKKARKLAENMLRKNHFAVTIFDVETVN